MHSNALLTEAAKMTIFNASAALFILDFFHFFVFNHYYLVQ